MPSLIRCDIVANNLAVAVDRLRGPFFHGRITIKLDLEEILGKKVDLVQYDAIKPRLRQYIMKDELIFF